jgi:UDP-glucose:(heptosyl)LPS alpha-1,3-glucosyltransferase
MLERLRVRKTPTRRVVAVSGLIMDQLHRSYGEQLPVDIIAPGVKLPVAGQGVGRDATRARLGWDADTIGCLLVARNPLRKGLPALLDALAQLPPRYKLLVVGADEPTRERVRATGHIARRVTLVDPTPDVGQYFEAADIYAHPTLNDSYGMAPLEAMSHGLPVVVSSPVYCGFAQYLAAGKDALILQDPRDGAQLAQALERLGSDPELRAALTERGLKIARDQSWETVASRYEALYKKVLLDRN